MLSKKLQRKFHNLQLFVFIRRLKTFNIQRASNAKKKEK